MMQIFQLLKVDGDGQSHHSAIAKFYEKFAHIEVRKEK